MHCRNLHQECTCGELLIQDFADVRVISLFLLNYLLNLQKSTTEQRKEEIQSFISHSKEIVANQAPYSQAYRILSCVKDPLMYKGSPHMWRILYSRGSSFESVLQYRTMLRVSSKLSFNFNWSSFGSTFFCYNLSCFLTSFVGYERFCCNVIHSTANVWWLILFAWTLVYFSPHTHIIISFSPEPKYFTKENPPS